MDFLFFPRFEEFIRIFRQDRVFKLGDDPSLQGTDLAIDIHRSPVHLQVSPEIQVLVLQLDGDRHQYLARRQAG